MDIKKKLVSNTLYLFLDWFFVFVFSLLFWVIIWKKLPPADSGIYSIAQNMILLISTFTLVGLSSAASKLIPEYIETKKNGMINSLLRFSFTVVFFVTLIIAGLVYLSGPIIVNFLPNFPLQAVAFVAIGIIFLSFEGLYGNILIGFQDMKKFFITDLVGNIFKFIAAFFLLFVGFNSLGPLAALVLSFAIIFLLRIDLRWLKKSNINVNKKFVVNTYAFPALLSSIGPVIFSNLPYIILAFISGLSATGIFTTAVSITSQLTVLVGILSNAIFPIVSQLSVYRNTKSRQNQIINLGVKYGLLVTLPVALVLILAPRAIILLLSQSIYLPATNLFSILSVSFVIMGLGTIFLQSLYAVRRPKTNRNIWLFSSLLFIVLSIPLTYFYSAFGISVAYFVSVAVLFVLSVFYLRKYLKFNLEWMNIFKMIFAGFVFVLFVFIADLFSLPNLGKYILGIAGFFAYFFALLFMKFFTKDDIKVLEILAEQLPFMKKFFLYLAKLFSNYS